MLDTMTKGTVRLRVPELLRERGWTARDLAEHTGLHYNTATQLARGYFDRIGLNTIAVLCDGLNVQPEDLFEYTSGEPETD